MNFADPLNAAMVATDPLEPSQSVPIGFVGPGGRLQRRETVGLSRVAQNSVPAAPNIHLPDGWTLTKNTRGQKGAD